jgi:hypothetical protein
MLFSRRREKTCLGGESVCKSDRFDNDGLGRGASDLFYLVRATIRHLLTSLHGRYDCTWNFEACGHAQSKKTRRFFLRSAI